MEQMTLGNGNGGRTRADQIVDRFCIFHRANHHIWVLFCRFADQARARGLKRYSARAIFHLIRWHTVMNNITDEGVELSNDYSPYYARMYMATHPGSEGFFKLKKLPSQDKPAYGTDIPFIPGAPPENEEALIIKLKALARETDDKFHHPTQPTIPERP